jgi:hypothetical protein
MRSSVGSSSLRRVRPSWIRNTNHVVVSINGCTQKRIVYNGKSQTKMDDLRVPPFWKPLCENGSSKGQDLFHPRPGASDIPLPTENPEALGPQWQSFCAVGREACSSSALTPRCIGPWNIGHRRVDH